MTSHRLSGERGQAAGFETIPFGILVFVTFTLLIVNAWGVVTNRGLADSMAREYLRAYVAAPSRDAARRDGRAIALAVAAGRGMPADRVKITDATAWGPCAVATVTVSVAQPIIRAPFVGGLGTTHITTTRRDLVDGHRAGIGPTDRANCDAN